MAKGEGLNADMISRLIDRAIEGMSYAYTPYSGFRVGAALLTESGEIYTGCKKYQKDTKRASCLCYFRKG